MLATTTPDGIVPGTAPSVQHGIGMHGGAFDLNAACSGFVYGLVTVAGLIAIGSGPVLLVGSETLSRITDMDDRKIAIIVGDGAGAVVVEPVEGPGSLISWNMNSDGSLRHLLKCEHGGTLFMDGKEVFRRAVRVVVESAERAMADAGLGPDDISLMVPAPGERAHHPGSLPAPRASPRSAPRSSSTATATPRRPPSRWRCTTPSSPAVSTTVTTSC